MDDITHYKIWANYLSPDVQHFLETYFMGN